MFSLLFFGLFIYLFYFFVSSEIAFRLRLDILQNYVVF